MPILHLKLSPAQPPARQDALAERLTAITHAILGKRQEVTAVDIEAAPRWYMGGLPAQRATAFLEISITEATNTDQEKEAFVAAAWRALREQLGELEEASYIVVRELPATDWGYGGLTQSTRRQRTVIPA
jgi:4-oxalocrotonate tautomerase